MLSPYLILVKAPKSFRLFARVPAIPAHPSFPRPPLVIPACPSFPRKRESTSSTITTYPQQTNPQQKLPSPHGRGAGDEGVPPTIIPAYPSFPFPRRHSRESGNPHPRQYQPTPNQPNTTKIPLSPWERGQSLAEGVRASPPRWRGHSCLRTPNSSSQLPNQLVNYPQYHRRRSPHQFRLHKLNRVPRRIYPRQVLPQQEQRRHPPSLERCVVAASHT